VARSKASERAARSNARLLPKGKREAGLEAHDRACHPRARDFRGLTDAARYGRVPSAGSQGSPGTGYMTQESSSPMSAASDMAPCSCSVRSRSWSVSRST
jgi:hypothetical protein